jgi:outer membrane protein TolC
MKKRIAILLLTVTSGFQMVQAQSDTTTLSLDQLYHKIVNYHPVVKQASMLSDVAKQELRFARGNFDPKIQFNYDLKHHNNIEYYRLFDGSLKINTNSPVNAVAGVERNKGAYVNPENYISDQYDYKLVYTGLSLPLGAGLLTDERRASLAHARLFGNLMEAEKVKMINKILLDAAKDYWEWYYHYHSLQLATQMQKVAEDIMRRVKLNVTQGEMAAIDSVQSRITVLERAVAKQEAYTALKNSSLQLSQYLWDSLANPVDLPSTVRPYDELTLTALSAKDLNQLREYAQVRHPELLKIQTKIQQLSVERKLAAEYLKPQLNVNYYLLNQPISPEGTTAFGMRDNYKLGVDFAFPLFLRKERAKLAQTNLKIANAIYDRELMSRSILNEVEVAYNELVNGATILQQQQEMVASYERLMRAELLNLENGESDLFKINIQQEKLYHARLKFLKVRSDYEKQKALLYWAAGSNLSTPLE